MIPGNFFSKCIEIERLIGSIYAHFAKNENYDEARRSMWTKLSQDEEGHALDLEFASRISLKKSPSKTPRTIKNTSTSNFQVKTRLD